MLPFLEVALQALHKQNHDDFVDRMNYYYSTLILLFLAILVSAKQYVGQPIQCWVPAQFRGGWEQYAENYCFVQNTYFLPFSKDVPRETAEREYRKIGYYQWVPIVLAIQALLFYLPNMIWNFCNWKSGIYVKPILQLARDAAFIDIQKRETFIQLLSRYLKRCISHHEEMRRHPRKLLCFKMCRISGSYLTYLYLFIKLLYVINVVLQFYLMNHFLGTNYQFWGLEILLDIAREREWSDSGHFPRVTLCDFDVRTMGNIHTHTVQCVLMINMFNEKIYIFLWFWMFILAICTVMNFIYWLIVSFMISQQETMIENYLSLTAEFENQPVERRHVQRFVRHVLKSDGILLLRFIGSHAGDMIMTELVSRLFQDFLEDRKSILGEGKFEIGSSDAEREAKKLPANWSREGTLLSEQ
ncbi:Innexin unc-9 [Trichinella papuae]|uniref:Innexin n=1 Tax=Trichinella papuae TaxID=268474 RepID=A0A0V1N7E7_9BILA|nr:Innexin unc-9 [Trichinella papuae]